MKLTEKVSIAALTVVLVKFILAGLTLKLGGLHLQFNDIDALSIAAILTPCVGAPHLETFVSSRSAKRVTKV